jgi:hypothetical protein
MEEQLAQLELFTQQYYAHTDAAGTTVLLGRVDLVDGERPNFAAMVCDSDARMKREA